MATKNIQKRRGTRGRAYNAWDKKDLVYNKEGKVIPWNELTPKSKSRFIRIFGDKPNSLRFWPKTEEQWNDKRGVKFLHDGSGYIVTIDSLPLSSRKYPVRKVRLKEENFLYDLSPVD